MRQEETVEADRGHIVFRGTEGEVDHQDEHRNDSCTAHGRQQYDMVADKALKEQPRHRP